MFSSPRLRLLVAGAVALGIAAPSLQAFAYMPDRLPGGVVVKDPVIVQLQGPFAPPTSIR